MVAFSDLRFDYRIFREATALRQAGHTVSLVAAAFNLAPLPEWDDFELHLIPVDRYRSLRHVYPSFWHRSRQLLQAVHADAYHAHDLDTLWPAAQAARRWDVPLIYDSHEFWVEQSSLVRRPVVQAFWSQLERWLVRNVHRTITVSASIARILQARYKLEQVIVLRNLPMYRKPVQSDRIRAELGLSSARPVVLYQGGFLTDNGLSEQVEAAADFGEAAFVLIGDGPCEEALKRQVQNSGLEKKVFFIPRVPFQELHSYTCAADLGLCLIKGTGKSFYYSMPNKLFEYLMAGLPVLASDFPEIRKVVTETVSGQVIDPQDRAAISRTVCQMLSDESRRRAYREAALKAAQLYNWEREAQKLIQLYENL